MKYGKRVQFDTPEFGPELLKAQLDAHMGNIQRLVHAALRWADVIQGGDPPETLEPWARECVEDLSDSANAVKKSMDGLA